MLRKLGCALHFIPRHRLTERHGRRLHRLGASRTIRRGTVDCETLLYPAELKALATSDAARIGGVAVQLDDLIRGKAGHLMQIVDVLRDHGRDPAGAVK